MPKNICRGVLPVILCLFAVLPASSQDRGHTERDRVCQGTCGGGCPCSGGSSGGGDVDLGRLLVAPVVVPLLILRNIFGNIFPAPESAPERPDPRPDPRIAQFNNKVAAAQAAARAGNMPEAVRLVREALAIREDSNLRQWLNESEAIVAANQTAHAADNALKANDLERAVALYRQAMRHPGYDTPDMRRFVGDLETRLRRDREEQAANEARRATFQTGLDRLTGVLSNMQPAASTGLDFYPATASGTPRQTGAGLDFLPASGAPQVVSNLGSVSPDIGLGAGANVTPLSRPRDANFGGGTAREQLEAAAGHGDLARRKPTSEGEAASDHARQVLDTPGARVPPPAVKPPDTPPGRPVAESAAPKPDKVVKLERNLEENRVKRENIEKEIERLKSEPQTQEKLVEISKKKDELGQAEQQRAFLTHQFRITQDQVDNSGGSPAAPQEQAGSEAR